MIIDNDGELCECGNRGCVETYASISSIPSYSMMSAKKLHWKRVIT
ncbi:MAG: ROK family protein [Peptostreptococcaceae bacterium]|nr:ROK family protein [Peptostreptococcaceae bacterium]